MASFGLRRAYGLLALLANVRLSVAQTTAATDVVGFIVEDDMPFSSVTCELNDYQVYRNGDGFLFCDATTDYFMATACTGGSTLLYVTTGDLSSATEQTLTCNEACTSLTVIQEYPSGGETWMIYDCLEYMAVPSGASIVYETLPSGVPSTTTADDPETTSDDNGSTSTDRSTRTTESAATNTNDSEDEDDDSGPDVPVIVGATVGSVAGVALIIAAIFIGIRIGRKKSAAGEGASGGSPFKSIPRPTLVWTRGADGTDQQQQVPPMAAAASPELNKYGGPPNTNSVMMAHPAQYPQPYMASGAYPPQQPIPQGYYPPQGYHPPEAYSPQPTHSHSTSPPPQSSELPTGYSAQGWATSEDHPHPYEMEAMLQPGQQSPRPQ